MRLQCAYLPLLWTSACAFTAGVPPTSDNTHARTTSAATPLRCTRLAILTLISRQLETCKILSVTAAAHGRRGSCRQHVLCEESRRCRAASFNTAEAFDGGISGRASSLMCKCTTLPLIVALSHVCWVSLAMYRRSSASCAACRPLIDPAVLLGHEKLRVYGFDPHGSSCCTSAGVHDDDDTARW